MRKVEKNAREIHGEAFALCLLGAAEATQPDVARSRSEVTAGAMGRLSTALCLP